MEFVDGRAGGFDFGEVFDEFFHEVEVREMFFGDDVAEEDEEGGEGVVENGPEKGC